MDKVRANEILSYAIQVLKGRKIISRFKGRLHIALLLKEELEREGFWWQADKIEIWLARAQKGEFIASASASERERRSGAQAERGGSSS